MAHRILFSPVGGHDPIANFRDGAVLHICRVYKPERVYLYLSHEMLERSRMDDRYRRSLEKLREHVNGAIQEIHLIERDELTQVQRFDAFYTDFDQLLRQIHEAFPDSELLLNLSSGTPAMKSALNVISVLSPFPMQAIQVSTPNQRENPKDEDPMAYDVETFWECNQDNEPDFPNRCQEVDSEHLLVKIKKESIQRLLNAYNYQAALLLAQEISEFISPRTMRMLEAAACRLQLDQRGYEKAVQGLDLSWLPVQTGNQRKVFEYVLSLHIKLAQGNYADFIRGLTPVVVDLFAMCLKNELGIAVSDFCEQDSQGVWKISPWRMERSQQGPRIFAALESQSKDGEVRRGPLGSVHMLWIFRELAASSDLVEQMERIRSVEEQVRNIAAHEIVSVTDDWLYRKVQLHAQDIIRLLEKLVLRAGIRVQGKDWKSYDQMNQDIIRALLEGSPEKSEYVGG